MTARQMNIESWLGVYSLRLIEYVQAPHDKRLADEFHHAMTEFGKALMATLPYAERCESHRLESDIYSAAKIACKKARLNEDDVHRIAMDTVEAFRYLDKSPPSTNGITAIKE